MRKFSIILLTYNSSNRDIKLTLDSILLQTFSDYEIIVSDDGSKKFDESFFHQYFREHYFNDYNIIANPKNQGTVKNLWSGLQACNGKYVKAIGPGDLLYDENVLNNIYQHMEQHQSTFLFGKMHAYSFQNKQVVYLDINLPLNLKCYIKKNYKEIERRLLVHDDAILGASMFFEYNTLYKYMQMLVDKVTYCEDYVRALIALNREPIDYYDQYVVVYQYYSGISTSGDSNGNNRLMVDKIAFLSYLQKQYPDNKNVRDGLLILELDNIKFRPWRICRKLMCAPTYIIDCIQRRRRLLTPTNQYHGFNICKLLVSEE